MSIPDFDPAQQIQRLRPIVEYAQSLPLAISVGDKPPLEDMLGRVIAGQAELADILTGLIHDLYKREPE